MIKSVVTHDGSLTLYSEKFQQHYHSVKEGAFNESLKKHIIPALQYHKEKNTITILDICFGLGYNTLATLYYLQKNTQDKKIAIFSPELDPDLIRNMKDFEFPVEFLPLQPVIQALAKNFYYEDARWKIELFVGDARHYLDILSKKNITFDIVYQDPFSSDINRSLWTQEYFQQIKNLLSDDAIITTYSIATPIRLSLYNNNLEIYEHQPENSNKITLAFNNKKRKKPYTYIDMELKKIRNKEAKALYDKDENV